MRPNTSSSLDFDSFKAPPIKPAGMVKGMRARFTPDAAFIEVLNDTKGTNITSEIIRLDKLFVYRENGEGMDDIREFMDKAPLYSTDGIGISKRGIGSKTFGMLPFADSNIPTYGAWIFKKDENYFGWFTSCCDNFKTQLVSSELCESKEIEWSENTRHIMLIEEDMKEKLNTLFEGGNSSIHIVSEREDFLQHTIDTFNDKKIKEEKISFIDKNINFKKSKDDAYENKELAIKYDNFCKLLTAHHPDKRIYINGKYIEPTENDKMILKNMRDTGTDETFDLVEDFRVGTQISKDYQKKHIIDGHYEKFKFIASKESGGRQSTVFYEVQGGNNRKKTYHKLIKTRMYSSTSDNNSLYTKNPKKEREILVKDDKCIKGQARIFQLNEPFGKVVITLNSKSIMCMLNISKQNFPKLNKVYITGWNNLGIVVNFNDDNFLDNAAPLEDWLDVDEVKYHSKFKDDMSLLIGSLISRSCNTQEKVVKEFQKKIKTNRPDSDSVTVTDPDSVSDTDSDSVTVTDPDSVSDTDYDSDEQFSNPDSKQKKRENFSGPVKKWAKRNQHNRDAIIGIPLDENCMDYNHKDGNNNNNNADNVEVLDTNVHAMLTRGGLLLSGQSIRKNPKEYVEDRIERFLDSNLLTKKDKERMVKKMITKYDLVIQ